jgi:phospholipase/carboxylesterase
LLEAFQIETGRQPTGTVIWLHGLGADGHDFAPIVPELVRPDERPLRFVFPHAPARPVTVNNGMAMRAWYDILGFGRGFPQDEAGIRDSDKLVRELIARETARGIPASRIVLGGFSQGGAISLFTGPRYPDKLAGIMGLSCYLLVEDSLPTERTRVNYTTPIFMGHGTQDPVVDIKLGTQAKQLLEAGGYPLEWHAYPMPHSVCPEEVQDIAAWLRKVL